MKQFSHRRHSHEKYRCYRSDARIAEIFQECFQRLATPDTPHRLLDLMLRLNLLLRHRDTRTHGNA